MSILKLKLSIGLLTSFLILLVLGSFIIVSINDFYRYNKATNIKLELTKDRLHFFIKNNIKKDLLKLTEPDVLKDDKSLLKTFHISIKQKDLDSLNIDLPTSGKDHYIEAFMNISDTKNKIYKIKLRYRGDQLTHWLYEQKSLRIKLAKGDIYEMQKQFNLINPQLIYANIDIINYNISKQLGLIAPEYYPVRVFINGQYMGVYMFLSQIDESLVRKNKIMPGSIYKGDYGVYNKPNSNPSTLWNDNRAWKKIASRNAEQKNNTEDIKYFISNINSLDNLKFYNFFGNFLDKKSYYNYFSLDVIFGSSHHDFAHNHFLYFDPYKGKFKPIQWDIRYWESFDFKDVSLYALLNKVKLNPILEYERDKNTYDLMNSKLFSNANIEKQIDTINEKIEKDLSSDILKDEVITSKLFLGNFIAKTFSLNKYLNIMDVKKEKLKKRKQKLYKIFSNISLLYNISYSDNNTILKFSVNGNSPAKIIFNTKSIVYRDFNFNGIIDKEDQKITKSDIVYPGRKWIKKSLNNWGAYYVGDKHLINSNLNYQFIVKEKVLINNLTIVNAITNEIITAKVGTIQNDSNTSSIHPWKLPIIKAKTIHLKGTIHIKETKVYDKYTTVTIAPNTTFQMDANTSLYFYGKVTAIGTKTKPIKFIAKDNTKPWGLIALQGKATSGSKFHYCYIENGSVDTRNLIHYTAQFNIHDMDNFEVKNSFIGKNYIGDDAMHIAYSTGLVDNCIFDGARSDGLDIDISDVNITNNIFKNSGNDGLDIMTTTMTASNNTFIDTGDKGISVGEWSDANITDSTFTRTMIGLEIKDKSKVVANNLTFVNTKDKAINLYNKNKRYDTGGFMQATNLKFIGNHVIKTDKRSNYDIK